ncbi:MAG: alpha/beta fold hydrolase [Dehalococcoidia bacterium]
MTAPTTLTWRNEGNTAMGVTERGFAVTREGDPDPIPGILWMPETVTGPMPLVLIGHGGGGNKRAATHLAIARRLVRRNGLAAAAIDAPGHGDRGGVKSRTEAYYDLWRDGRAMAGRSSEDWRATLDALLALGQFDAERIGWWGLSMGTLIGLPYVASEPRIRAAVLGLCGVTGETPSRSTIGEVLAEAAAEVTVPVLFMVQWDDERFDRDGSLRLFDLLASRNKRLMAYPGKHGETPEEAGNQTRDFLEWQLQS